MKKLDPITPGDILLEEFLKPFDISMNRLAMDIRVPVGRISQIVSGKRDVTTNTAYRLGKYFRTGPEFWMNLQVNYNLKKEIENWDVIQNDIKIMDQAAA